MPDTDYLADVIEHLQDRIKALDAFLLLVVCYWAVPWRERTSG